jgi:mannosyltransferase
LPRPKTPLQGPQPRGFSGRDTPEPPGANRGGPPVPPAPGASQAAAQPAAAPSASAAGAAWFVPLVPAIAAFAAGLYHVARPSYWRDEAYTIEVASRAPGQILSLLRHADAVHGAYYLCMHYVVMLFGRSETAVRLPSVAATAVAAGFLAAAGLRLAASSGMPWPRSSGVLAGMLYAAAPMASRYAQEARSYATVTACVVIASYLLVRALEDGRRRWWVGYAAAIAFAGLFNLLALLIIPAHAITVAIAARRPRPRPRRWPWAVATAAALVALTPLITVAYTQRSATYWLVTPGTSQAASLATSLAGSGILVVPVGALIVIAVAARVAAGRTGSLGPADVAGPWLVAPPAILLAVSQVHPLYDFRYVLFSLPAVALLAADGLSRLAMLAARYAARIGSGMNATVISWLAPALVIVFIAAASVPPQQAIRRPWSRTDYLRKVSQIVDAHARPGDAVLYLGARARIVSQGYPAPFRKLRDLALARSQLASATLNGVEVTPAVLRGRFAGVSRVWIISDSGPVLPAVHGALDIEKLALARTMRMIGHWHTRNDLILLYARQ